jgi:hypothetical protein
MKKTILGFLLILTSFSCKRETYSEVAASNSAKNLVGKYVVSYMEGSFNIQLGNTILFNSDNTLTVFYSNSAFSGSWTIMDNKLSIPIIKSNNVKNTSLNYVYDIVKLSDKELILNIEQYTLKLIKE